MRRALVLSFLVGSGCTPSAPVPGPHKVALRRTGGTTFELVPAEGQLEHCLAYTVNARGLFRQLTMSRRNESYHCPARAAVGGHAYRVPLAEGPVKVLVLFTSGAVNAASVSQQLLELANPRSFKAMDLRLPGQAALELLDFSPEEDVAATEGGELQLDGGLPDAGG
jgi:hypothetical protein